MATTPNFGWTTPDDSDYVKDGASAMRTLGDAIDASMVDLKGGTTGQILSKNSNTDMDFVWIANDQGDITGVTAGTGLTGGGTSGAVTVSIDTTVVPRLGVVNTFTANQVIQVTDNTNAALRVTQLGTGEAIRVEDSANVDATAFAVTADGTVYAGGSFLLTGAAPTISQQTAGDRLVVTGGLSASTGGAIVLRDDTAVTDPFGVEIYAGGSERMRVDTNGLITGSGTSLGAWTAYTPTVSNGTWAIGNGTIAGAYCQIGKIVHFRAMITFGTTSVFDATSTILVTAPVNSNAPASPANQANNMFTALARDVSAGAWHTIATRPFNVASATFGLYVLGTNGLHSNVTSTAPFTWASGDYIYFAGTYEAA